MREAFCTITSLSHLYKTRSLIQSIREFKDCEFYVLVVDSIDTISFDDARYVSLNFLTTDIAKSIIRKYKNKRNKLRWGLKPAFMLELLNGYCDKLIYVDNDVFFYSSPDFLFKKLDMSDVLLTPHNCNSNPTTQQIWFEANYWIGLYNAGFFAANKNSLHILNWWAQCCFYNISLQWWRGLYDDQKYLDLLPIAFDNVEVLNHKGCNVAGWNLENCKRFSTSNGIRIEPNYEIVFIHFTALFFTNMNRDRDMLLVEYYNKYVNTLLSFNPKFVESSQMKRSIRDYFLSLRYIVWLVIRKFD